MRMKIAPWRYSFLTALFSFWFAGLVGCDAKTPKAERATSLLASKRADVSVSEGAPIAENVNDLAKRMYKDEVWTYLNKENPISHEVHEKYFRGAGDIYIQGVAERELTKEPPIIVLSDGTRVWLRNTGGEDWPDGVKGKTVIASGRVVRSETKFEPGAPMLPGSHAQSYDFELDKWDLATP